MTNLAGTALAIAAERLIGAPFKLRGRDPLRGVDCIGLVHCALRDIGRSPPPIPHYTLRNIEFESFLPLLAQANFELAPPRLEAGDLLLLRPSAAQFHLAILAHGERQIHAHAGLGRVVSTPLTDDQIFEARWRLS